MSPPLAPTPAAPAPLVPVVAPRGADLAPLAGLSRTELVAALGPPDFVRRDAPAEILQYRAAECILDVFLYRTGGEARVEYAEARPRAGTTRGDQCLAALARRTAIRSTRL